MAGPVHVAITLGGVPGRARLEYGVSGEDRVACIMADKAVTLPLGPGQSVEHIVAAPEDDGYWTAYAKVAGATQVAIDCPGIGCSGPIDWWHEVHGIRSSNVTRGEGIRIGVVDHSLGDQKWIDAVANLKSWHTFVDGERVDRVALSNTDHGQDICLLLGAHSGTGSPCLREGVAPGASLHFVGAGATGADEDKVEIADVALAVGLLSKEIGCDLIVLSLGKRTPSPNLYNAIELARDVGTLCICAAGNSDAPALYPARHKQAVGVAALGKSGVAPRGTLGAATAAAVDLVRGDGELFAWESSARGDGVDAIGAGVSVISPAGRGFDLDGTSYAAPIVAGVLAIALAADAAYMAADRTRRRANLALARLKACCRPMGFPPGLFGYGMPGF